MIATPSNAGRVVPLIDARVVTKALKKSNVVPIQFIDSNNDTFPAWCRKDNILIDDQTAPPLASSSSSVIEIDDESKRLNVDGLSSLSVSENFWDDVRSMIEDTSSLKLCDDETSKIQSTVVEIIMKTQKHSKLWQTNNTKTIQIHETHLEQKSRHCPWEKMRRLMRPSDESTVKSVHKEEVKSAIQELIKAYGEKVVIEESLLGADMMSSFFVHAIRAVNDLHVTIRDVSETGACMACNAAKEIDIMRYVIIASILYFINYDKTPDLRPPYDDINIQSNLKHMDFKTFF